MVTFDRFRAQENDGRQVQRKEVGPCDRTLTLRQSSLEKLSKHLVVCSDGPRERGLSSRVARLWQAVAKMADHSAERQTLTSAFATWRHSLEETHRRRRDAFVDSLSEQTQSAKHRCVILERASQRGPLLLAMAAWRLHVRSLRHRKHLLQAAYWTSRVTEQVAQSAWRLFMAWRVAMESTTSVEQPPRDIRHARTLSTADVSQTDETHLESLHETRRELRKNPSRGVVVVSPARSRPRCGTDRTPLGRQARSPRQASSDVRKLRLEVEDAACCVTPTQRNVDMPRGPERFFYDRASYTGCARFGGPSVRAEEAAPRSACGTPRAGPDPQTPARSRKKCIPSPNGALDGGGCSPKHSPEGNFCRLSERVRAPLRVASCVQ